VHRDTFGVDFRDRTGDRTASHERHESHEPLGSTMSSHAVAA
jgi:hypothetical protein